MTKEYTWSITHDTWTVTYKLNVDFNKIYDEMDELQSEYKLTKWAISTACNYYFAGISDEIYYNLDEDVGKKVEKDFTEWLKEKIKERV